MLLCQNKIWCDAVRYFSIILQPYYIHSYSRSNMNPNPPTPCESSFCDWQLLFACPCLKAKASSFLLRHCRARGWWKDLDWRGLRGKGLVVWHWPLRAESCLAEALGRELSRADYEGHISGQKKAPLHCQTSMHIKANCPFTKTHACAWCTPACVNKGGKHTHLQACNLYSMYKFHQENTTWKYTHMKMHMYGVLWTEGKKVIQQRQLKGIQKKKIKKSTFTDTQTHTKSPS